MGRPLLVVRSLARITGLRTLVNAGVALAFWDYEEASPKRERNAFGF